VTPVATDPAAARARLGAAQHDLVAALVAGAPAPPGFAADRVAAAADALLRKRAREIAAVWPALAVELGARFADQVAGTLRGRPPAGALTDGWRVARELAAAGWLPPAARTELATVEATHRIRAGRLVHRRGVGLPATRTPSGLALAIRVGRRIWWLPRA